MYLLVVAGMTLHNKTSLILCHQTLCPLNGRCGDMILIMYTMVRLHILESKVIIIIYHFKNATGSEIKNGCDENLHNYS